MRARDYWSVDRPLKRVYNPSPSPRAHTSTCVGASVHARQLPATIIVALLVFVSAGKSSASPWFAAAFLSSGIYFARLESDANVRVTKVVVAR